MSRSIRDVSLAVVFKGPEGIVLAADSRVTLTSKQPGTSEVIPAYFDNATKLLSVDGQDHVGIVTYGQGAIGTVEPRTAHSFLPEFDAHLIDEGLKNLAVEDVARALGAFFSDQWQQSGMPTDGSVPPMVFLVAGYDRDEAYGKVYEIQVPTSIDPVEQNAKGFGVTWGGQQEIVQRLLHGADLGVGQIARDEFNLDDAQVDSLLQRIKQELALPIPYQFLPLQDCVDLATYLVTMTATVQTWTIGVRGVGGAVDVATVTRTEGFQPIRQKRITVDD